MNCNPSSRRGRQAIWPERAFTLVEVILAIVIALAILVVLLFFYQQATNVRGQAIAAAERIGAARLLMDRLTGELRTIVPIPSTGSALIGNSNSIQFVRSDLPSFAAWSGGPLGRAAVPVTDLKLMRYRLEVQANSNVAGLFRSEEPLIIRRETENADAPLNVAEVEPTNSAASDLSVPVVEEIKYLQFRYWSGTNWQDSWNAPLAPEGIEVSLGSEAATNGTDLTEYPAEIFRRVIHVSTKSLVFDLATSTNAATAAVTGRFDER